MAGFGNARLRGGSVVDGPGGDSPMIAGLTIGNVAADMSLTAIVSARTEGVTVSEDSCAAREVTTALPSWTAQGERQQFRDPGH